MELVLMKVVGVLGMILSFIGVYYSLKIILEGFALRFTNNFRVVKFDKLYCVQQQSGSGRWYFIRNVSAKTAEQDALVKKDIIRSIRMNDYKFFYDYEEAKQIVKILSKNWDLKGTVE